SLGLREVHDRHRALAEPAEDPEPVDARADERIRLGGLLTPRGLALRHPTAELRERPRVSLARGLFGAPELRARARERPLVDLDQPDDVSVRLAERLERLAHGGALFAERRRGARRRILRRGGALDARALHRRLSPRVSLPRAEVLPHLVLHLVVE